VRGHSSFSVHFFAAITVLLLAACLNCQAIEWAILGLCITLVIGFELANSTVEILVRCFPEEDRSKFYPALDVAAGTVLFASCGAVLIGAIVLLPKIITLVS
jgi:diacylglycerol kinase